MPEWTKCGQQRGFSTNSALNNAAAPSMSVSRSVDVGGVDIEPTLSAVDLTGTRQPENKIDMALDMLDVNSMDTGRCIELCLSKMQEIPKQ